jgi:serine/threonine protein kinase
MEFLPHGDLEKYLYNKHTLPEPEVQQIAFQVLEGLKSMHENGFAHRDLKPSVSVVLSWFYLDAPYCGHDRL